MLHGDFIAPMVTLAGLHSTRGYCGSSGTVGTADGYCRVLQVLRVLWMYLGTAQYPWVLQGTVGTVGTVTVGYCGYCRWVLQGTAERIECSGRECRTQH